MQLQSILATQERAAGALTGRQRSTGYFEIRRMLDLECPLAAPNRYAIVAALLKRRDISGRYPAFNLPGDWDGLSGLSGNEVPCRIKAERLRLRNRLIALGLEQVRATADRRC